MDGPGLLFEVAVETLLDMLDRLDATLLLWTLLSLPDQIAAARACRSLSLSIECSLTWRLVTDMA